MKKKGMRGCVRVEEISSRSARDVLCNRIKVSSTLRTCWRCENLGICKEVEIKMNFAKRGSQT